MPDAKTAARSAKIFAAQNDATDWIELVRSHPLSVSLTGTVTAGTVIELQHSLDQSTAQTVKSYTATAVFDYEPSMPPGFYRMICTTYAAAGQPTGRLWN